MFSCLSLFLSSLACVNRYVVNLKEKEFVEGPWCQPNVELGANMLIPVPFGGVLIVGQMRSVAYFCHRYESPLCVIKPASQFVCLFVCSSTNRFIVPGRDFIGLPILCVCLYSSTCFSPPVYTHVFHFLSFSIVYHSGVSTDTKAISTYNTIIRAYGRIDADGSRYLLGDHLGNLHVLVLRNDGKSVVGLDMERLGETSVASTISYLDNGVVFVGYVLYCTVHTCRFPRFVVYWFVMYLFSFLISSQ